VPTFKLLDIRQAFDKVRWRTMSSAIAPLACQANGKGAQAGNALPVDRAESARSAFLQLFYPALSLIKAGS